MILKWLENTFPFYENIMCMLGNGTKAYVMNITISEDCPVVETHDASVYKNIMIVVVLVLAPLLLCVSVIALRHYLNKRKKKLVVKDNALTNINYEYVVFLSFSSDDDLFIDTRVMQPLEQCLRQE